MILCHTDIAPSARDLYFLDYFLVHVLGFRIRNEHHHETLEVGILQTFSEFGIAKEEISKI
jgi:hypothetical protein